VILVDTGPFVALFDPRDDAHGEARETLRAIAEPMVTTVAVLTEAFHLLDPASAGSRALRAFVAGFGVAVWFMSDGALARAFELMERYADHPMDLADASLVVAAEELRCTKIFTIDRDDFATYRARIGRGHRGFRIVGR
jgi:predicted nucleic acid-binding protein